MGLLLIGLGVLLIWVGVRTQNRWMRYAGFASLAVFALLLFIAWPVGGSAVRIQ